jgi:hypothetical protein
MSRLLLISCSARKRSDPGSLPALERYDGPAFRVLRKQLRTGGSVIRVLVLSAKFGLIPADLPIPDYDQRLTAAGAEQLRPGVLKTLRAELAATTHIEIGLCLSRLYLNALAGFEAAVPGGVGVVEIGGGLGPRLSRLRDWLRSPLPARTRRR